MNINMDIPGFKEAAEMQGTSSSTIIRRFKKLVAHPPSSAQLPKSDCNL